ncbi:tripartite tricarboxylate transporter substrate binding protein [Cupriavidus sp. IK-TO18]|uniref:tripartite tricarboxylate transporter substrate binding protein n=1 Tax=Cupriavidus sp. IK-TO18 TaxID=2782182 RepID=UPI001896B67A|nr:tripartite tricarboxylate transporter substrate binding protein [Cupriavidus sp. IK-TO18]MBF6989154.1 tripartite tricarboxylate transporter substrate binding protein [Cupriavidus sp. IK-TO18]
MQAQKFVRLSLFALAGFAACAAAEPYPSRPVTVIVPFAAGGNLDVTARTVLSDMSKALGQSFVVDNRVGAGGLIGHEAAARAKPDGYTIVATANGSFAYTPKIIGKPSFTPKDFAPIGMMAVTPLVLEVPVNSRFKSFQELAAFAKANPGKVSIGHAGVGTTNHVAIIQLQAALGTTFTIVPYKGSAPAITDLLGSQLDAVIDQLPSSLPNLKAGKLRALAVTSKMRALDLPQVSTLQEHGLKNFEVVTVSGLMAPAKTPPEILQPLHDALNRALADPAVKQRLQDLGSIASPATAKEFDTLMRDEDARAGMLAKQGLLKAE